MQKKSGWVAWGSGSGQWGQMGGCEPRIEVILKMKKKSLGGSGPGEGVLVGVGGVGWGMGWGGE